MQHKLQSVQCILIKGIPHLRITDKAFMALKKEDYDVCINYADNYYINVQKCTNKVGRVLSKVTI